MRLIYTSLLTSSLLLMSQPLLAVENSMAQTGFTGLLRVPHAESLPFGDLSLNYHWEDNIDFNTCYGCGSHNTVLMGVGLLPGLEFTVQNTHKLISDGPGWGPDHSSDLSFSSKYDFKPFLPKEWFSFAVGVQDYGGAATKHENAYAVVSKSLFSDTFYNLRLTTGYGKGSRKNQMGKDYLQGTFAGIEWQPTEWMQLVADHDGTGANAGIKLFTQDNWLPYGWKANVTYQLYSSSETFNRNNQWLGFGLTLPMTIGTSSERHSTEGVKEWTDLNEEQKIAISQMENTVTKSDKEAEIPSIKTLENNKNKQYDVQKVSLILVDYGFENVRAGWLDKKLVVEFENNLFNWNELDGLGVALGLIVNNSNADSFQVTLLNNQLAVITVSGDSQQYKEFLIDINSKDSGLVVENAKFTAQGIEWEAAREASSHFVPRFIFSPHLRSSMGTEYGVFDYSLALSSNVQMSVWKGGVVDVRHLLPITHSDSYADGEGFAKSRHKNEVDRILFHQAISLPAGFMTQFSAGQVYKSYRGILNESRWQSPSGTHRVKTELGNFSREGNNYDYRPTLASYRYFVDDLDLAVEATYGQHWAGDLGYSVGFKQWFGDLSVNLTYQNTNCDRQNKSFSCSNDGYAKQHEYAGLVFQLPIGMRKNHSPAIGLQLKTLEQWGYGYRSRINNHANYIGGNRGSKSNFQYNVEQQYYNRDRLSEAYIVSNMQRLRESYLDYIK